MVESGRLHKVTHTEQYLKETIAIAESLDADKVEEMVKELVSLRERKGRLFIIGLGGSAANASHAVNDFRKLCGIETYAPTDNVAQLTAIANDIGWSHIFSEWMDLCNGYPSNDDALLILSVGGGTDAVSLPLGSAIAEAHMHLMKVFGIVGRDGGYTAEHGDCVLIVPTVEAKRVTPHTEGWQSVILHCLVSHPDLQIRKTKW
jgi:D-sedoheptulose 7-phosphate isomerase